MNKFQDKYIALALGNSRGLKLIELVEENWLVWVATVNNSFWLRTWVRSKYYDQPGLTPQGNKVPFRDVGESIALVIFTSAVWGYGFELWEPSGAAACRKLKALKNTSYEPEPVEYDALDKWLSTLWLQI